MKENRGAVLSAEIRTLPVHLRDRGSAKTHSRVVRNSLLPGQTSPALPRHGRFHPYKHPDKSGFRVPAAVAYSRIHHSGHALERGLDPPKHSAPNVASSAIELSPLLPPTPSKFLDARPALSGFNKANMQSKTLCAAPAPPDLLAFPAPTPCTGY